MKITTSRDRATFFHEQWGGNTGVSIDNKAIRANFHRIAFMPSWEPYVADLIQVLDWQTTHRVVVIGATFGMVEQLTVENYGLDPAKMVSCDDSDWILSAQLTDEDQDMATAITSVGSDPMSDAGMVARKLLSDGPRARLPWRFNERNPILPLNLMTTESRGKVTSLLGGIPDIVFTDDLLDYLTDDEAVALSGASALVPPNIAVQHAIGPEIVDDPRINAKGIVAWKALLPNDTFYDWSTSQVL